MKVAQHCFSVTASLHLVMADRAGHGSLSSNAVEDASAAKKIQIEEEMQSLFRVMAAYMK